MSKEISGSASENQPPSAAKPPITADEVAAIETANSLQQSKREQAESPENHKSELASLVMDHWEEEGGETKCFEVSVTADMVPDKVVHYLTNIEADYELDILASLENNELSPEDVGDFLADEIHHTANERELEIEKSETAVQKAKAEETLKEEKSYTETVNNLKASGKSNTEIINALVNDENVPETERAKLKEIQATLARVVGMGGSSKAQKFFAQAVDSQPINFEASAPRQIYASLISHIDTGLSSGLITASDANAARVTLGVAPKTTSESYKIPKDSKQMARELRDRRNTEEQVPTIDPTTGEPMVDSQGNVIYETITTEHNDPIPIDHPSLEIYLKPEPGSDAYYVHILSDSRLPLVERIDANNFSMGGMREINYLVATADMEQQGYTDMFGSQFTSNEVRRYNFENFMRSTGMNPDFGNLWTTEHSDRINQMMQMLHPRGDLGRDDVNPRNWKERATELGVYNAKADQWDYDALSIWRDGKIFGTVGKGGEAFSRSEKTEG